MRGVIFTLLIELNEPSCRLDKLICPHPVPAEPACLASPHQAKQTCPHPSLKGVNPPPAQTNLPCPPPNQRGANSPPPPQPSRTLALSLFQLWGISPSLFHSNMSQAFYLAYPNYFLNVELINVIVSCVKRLSKFSVGFLRKSKVSVHF